MNNDITPLYVADIIEQFANGKLVTSEVQDQLIQMDFGEEYRIVNEAIHCLSHFATDADIRKRDSEYDEHLRTKLRGYAQKIRQLVGGREIQ